MEEMICMGMGHVLPYLQIILSESSALSTVSDRQVTKLCVVGVKLFTK